MSNIKPVVVLPYDKEKFGGADIGDDQTPNITISENTPPAAAAARVRRREPVNRNDRQTRILKIVMKLVKNDAFNENLQIRNEDGSFNHDSNVSKLLNITQNKVPRIKGMPEFINHLHQANVNPEFIVNEMIKQQLLNLNRGQKPSSFGAISEQNTVKSDQDVRKYLVPKRKAKRQIQELEIEKPLKRTRNDDNEEALDEMNQIAKDIKEEGGDWEIPFDDNESN